jgi:hypothetical protein
MRDLQLYDELCKIDLYNQGLQSRYPYTIKQDMTFTQNEMVLHYRQNYCESVAVLEEPAVAGGEPEATIEYAFLVVEKDG